MSATGETLQRQTERLSRLRRRMLALIAVAFLVSEVGIAAKALSGGEPSSSGHARFFDLMATGGSVVWGGALLILLPTFWRKTARAGQAVHDTLEDELTKANRRRAFHDGYWALLFAVWVIYAVTIFHPFEMAAAMPILIAVGVTVPILRFVVLDRRGESSG
jgi:hypothetical protein